MVAAGRRHRGRRSRHVRATGTAPRGRRVRGGADDRVDDRDQDRPDPGTTQAAVRARPVVSVPRGRRQRERHQGLFAAVRAVFRSTRST